MWLSGWRGGPRGCTGGSEEQRGRREKEEETRPLKELCLSHSAPERRDDTIWLTYQRLPRAGQKQRNQLGSCTVTQRNGGGDLILRVAVEVRKVVDSVFAKL